MKKTRERSDKSSASRGSDKTAGKVRKKMAASEDLRPGSFLGARCVLDIEAENKEELLRRLAEAIALETGYPSAEQIYRSASEREAVVNTYLGGGVAVPHARISSFDGFAIAVARNRNGFPFGVDTDQPVKIVILLVGNESLQKEHVRLLGAIAAAVKDEKVRTEILEAEDAAAVCKVLDAGAKVGAKGPRRRPGHLTKLLLSHSRKIARDIGATAVLVAIENPEELTVLRRLPKRESFIVATRSARIADSAEKLVKRVIRLPRTPFRRGALVRVGTLMGVSHGFISRDDVVAFLSGQKDRGLDTFTVISVPREFGKFLTASGEISRNVSTSVLERVLTLASELAREGREGKPIGTIFVIGDPDEIAPHCQQLVINPFRGYPDEEKNILDPTLQETIKEFATIDGAFILRGDGVIQSAGTYLRPDEVEVTLPSGFGTRHRAAAAITALCDCVSMVVSESTGHLMLFRKGAAILTAEKAE